MLTDMKKKIRLNTSVIKLFVLIFFLNSCETITNIPEKVLKTGSETLEYVGSIFDDNEDVDENVNEDNEILAAEPEKIQNDKNKSEVNATSETNKVITEADQVLDAVPTENVYQNEVEQIKPDELVKDDQNLALKTNKNNELNQNDNLKYNNSELKFDLLDTSLKLENKIQFKIGIINFTSGSSVLSVKDKRKIKKIINLAKKKKAIVKIVGHASTRTKDMPALEHKLANFNVSDMRAQSVAREFIQNKFPASNLITEAVSDSRPLFHESMPAGTYGNQRTEIYLIY